MDPSWKYCPVCLAPLAGWLVEIDKDGKSRKFYTIHEGKSFIGSGADCEIRILSGGLCRQQAQITVKDRLCTITDMGNGCAMRVNNMVKPHTNAIDGDLIEFGESRFLLKLL